MKKIYIVTSGEYSDYHICGVYDDKDKAQKFIDSFPKNEYSVFGIEEYDLNLFEVQVSKGMKPYFLRMDRNGKAYGHEIKSTAYGFAQRDSYGFAIDGSLFNHCFAKDEKHATKITNELRARLIAENKWDMRRDPLK